jgi:hypothetical protein
MNIVPILSPFFSTLVIGLIFISNIYYKSKERQMLIEKGYTPEQIEGYLRSSRITNLLIKIGMIVFFFGVGLGLGTWVNDIDQLNRGKYSFFWVTFFIFVFTGIGFVIAGLVDRYIEQILERLFKKPKQ